MNRTISGKRETFGASELGLTNTIGTTGVREVLGDMILNLHQYGGVSDSHRTTFSSFARPSVFGATLVPRRTSFGVFSTVAHPDFYQKARVIHHTFPKSIYFLNGGFKNDRSGLAQPGKGTAD